ncbi:MAG: PrsW family glutamic-type intramembrane protease [Chloroflexota bacterium]
MQAKVEPGWRFWLLAVLLGGGAALSLGTALLFLVLGLAMAAPLLGLPQGSAGSFLNIAFTSAFVGTVMLVGLVWLIRPPVATAAEPAAGQRRLALASLAMLIWLPLVGLFRFVESSALAWLLLPPLVVLGAVIPAWFLIELARRGLNVLPRGRSWQILSVSFALTIPLTLLLSLVMLAVFVVVLGVYLNTQPQLLADLQRFFEQFDPADVDLQQLELIANQILANPVIVALLISLVAGVTPLLEELLKPLALWLYAGDRLSPAQGFVGGALCGAAFGLWENLSALAGAGNGGGVLILVARVGSLLLHITATAIFGWGLASFWGQRRYWGRLVGSYLLAVGLHAFWNLFGVLSAVPVTPRLPLLNRLPVTDQTFNPLWLVLPGMALLNLLLLVWMNYRLQREAQTAIRLAHPSQTDSPAAGTAQNQPAADERMEDILSNRNT